MKKTAVVALGFAAAIAATPAFAECAGHTGTTAQGQSTPAPIAQTTAPADGQQVILTQNGTIPATEADAQ
ncbi:MAG: hypothetical protein JNN33_13000 [Rhodospirillaceae bacterium]|jgi:hypothetical protein|nr:hypothetical protein [Rhodospirillaceae bacterium]